MALILRQYCKRLLFVLIFALLDCTVCTVLFCHGNHAMTHFSLEVNHYHFAQSVFELWVFSATRTAVLLGSLLGLVFNPTDAPRRFGRVSLVILILAVIMWAYPLIKMLVISEANPNFPELPWFWSIFSWSILGSVMFYISWSLLIGLHQKENDKEEDKSKAKSGKGKGLSINRSNGEDREALLDIETDPTQAGDGKEEEKENKKKPKARVTVWRLVAYSKPDIPFLLIAFIFMVVSTVAEIFTPWYTGQVIQGIAIEKSRAKFTRAIIIMSLLAAGSSLAAGIRGGFFKVAMARLNIRIRNHLFASLMQQEVGFFDTTKTGDITSRLTSDVTTMSDCLSLNVNVFLRSIIKAIGVVVFMVKLSWELSMVTLIGLPIIMGVSEIYGKYYQKLSEKVQDSLAKANEVAEEVLSSMKTVRSFANEMEESSRYAQKLRVTFKLKLKESLAYAGYMWSSGLFSLSLVVATLYYGGHLVINDILQGGDLVSFILYQIELGYALESISYVYTGLMEAVGASEKVMEFIDRKPEISNTGKLQPTHLRGELEFDSVVFAYPSRPETEVLKGLSFHVNPGEVVALVGPSGGGKSSCVNLLQHFYETKAGTVKLDGVNIQEYDHSYLHSKISLVGQEPVLYARSIKENIAYGMEEWDMAKVQEAATLANAHGFITDMDDGYDTETGEKGQQLSGGQKQRVAIARAVIRDPVVLILDEATSALDAESEHIVQEALYRNLRGRSVVIIAHRLSTVEKADKIVFISKGEVVEQGTHTELLRRGDKYAKLVQRQLLGLDIGIPDDLSMGPPQPEPAARGKESRKKAEKDNVSCNSFRSIEGDGDGVHVRGHSRENSPLVTDSPVFGTPKFIVGSVNSNC